MDNFYKDGLCFNCVLCHACCRHDPGFVFLSGDDIDRIISLLSIKKEDFIKTYCREIDVDGTKKFISLKEKENFDCIFWNNGCSIYKARPIQCQTYPFWDHILESKEDWEEEAQDCPGINTGEKIAFEEIQRLKNQYIENKKKY